MRFLNPNGLWLLLGVPILILIYIIRAQHEDRPVSSTYIWKLSQKFMKKRLPLQRFRTILLFALQLLAIVAAAILAARPGIVNGQVKDYILIVDASGSMQTVNEDGVSRFDRAVTQMDLLSDEMKYGNRIAIIQATNEPSILLETSDSQSEVKLSLQNLKCRSGDMDLDTAMNLAARLAWRSSNPQVILYTDLEPAEELTIPERVTVINVADTQREWDVSVKLTDAIVAEEYHRTTFVGNVISVGKNKRVSVGLRLNGKIVDAAQCDCYDGVDTEVRFTQPVTEYDSAELFVNVEDSLPGNNSDAICPQNVRSCKILLASQSPLYLKTALESLGNCELTVISSFGETAPEGYDLYIFDRIQPERFPEDGSMILILPDKLPAGIAYGKTYDREGKLAAHQATPDEVTDGLLLRDTVIGQYNALIGNASWTNELSCNYSPVLATKRFSNGLSCAVLSFDLHDTNLTLQQDFLQLIRNLVRFCAPSLLTKTEYAIDETVTVSVLPRVVSLYLKTPDGKTKALPSDSGRAYFQPDKTGTYTIVQTSEAGGSYADFFVRLPDSELTPKPIEAIPSVEPGLQQEEAEESVSEIGMWVALLLLVLLIAEWEVYYYDQY